MKACLIKEGSLHVGKFHDHQKLIACWKIFSCGKISWSKKKLILWKTFLIKEKSLVGKLCPEENFFNHKESLLVENFHHQGKVFACRKTSWSSKNLSLWKNLVLSKTSLLKKKNLCFWKFSLIKKKFLFAERFSWSLKNICLQENLFFWKTSLIKENCSSCQTCLTKEKTSIMKIFLDQGKIFACGKLILARKHLYW